MNKIISLGDLACLLNKSKITIWRYWAKAKVLPAPILINGKCLGWKESTITEWLENQEVKK